MKHKQWHTNSILILNKSSPNCLPWCDCIASRLFTKVVVSTEIMYWRTRLGADDHESWPWGGTGKWSLLLQYNSAPQSADPVSRHVFGCCLTIYLRNFMNYVSYTVSNRTVNVSNWMGNVWKWSWPIEKYGSVLTCKDCENHAELHQKWQPLGVWEQGAEENIRAHEGLNNRRLEKTVYWRSQ
jgi:hypothetical protein